MPITQNGGPVIAREPKSGAPTEKDHRDAVKAAIANFTNAASTIGSAQAKVNAASFETSINSWYAKVTDTQQLIKDKLSDDVLLDRDLQASYISAIRALMPKAATALSTTEDALYGVNSARIPLWAWQSEHRLETNISTPLDQGQPVDPLSGDAGFSTASGANVKILGDMVDPSVSTPVTRLLFPVDIPFTTVIAGKSETIDDFTAPANLATIQTAYPPGMPGSTTSGYGRGTTAEDIAGGKANPQSTTLRWHEGNHGLDYVAYLKAHPLPTFNGTKGMTRKKFTDEIATYKVAVKAYAASAEKASNKLTHCVGTTIDTYNQANPVPGTKVKLECTP
ncbi:hypothetical protein [Aquabacterium sp.]|uniref:hypothetical protein n=1 Tax=Aquabacterium sp. TaxID=1872578 RepID=UPI00198BDB5A|nr:hypothetical protein [Aquabacterium sp.]MBC7701440.1 hypothetical protein [Aquabacterium sp.]